MSLQRKISKLKDADALQVNKKWLNDTRYELLDEIASQNRMMRAQQLSINEKLDLFFSRVLRRIVPSASKVIAGFLVIMMGSGLGFAAQASVPGQALWPVKRSIEKAELTITFSAVKETEIYIKHLNKRLNEIDKILLTVETEPDRVAKQEKAIKQVVRQLEKDVTNADSTLKIVKEEESALQVVELAKIVTDATNEAVETLEEQATHTVESGIEEALAGVKVINEEISDSALALAVEVHEDMLEIAKSAEVDGLAVSTSTVTREDADEAAAVKVLVTGLVAAEIDELNTDIDVSIAEAGIVDGADFDQVKVDVKAADNKDDAAVSEDIEAVELMSDIPEEAKERINEAKVLLDEGSLQDALDKVSETKVIQETAETVLDKIEKINEEADNDEAEASSQTDNSTSTQAIIEEEEMKIETAAVAATEEEE